MADFFELYFELLHQRVAAAVEVGDCHELCGCRLRVRTHAHLDLAQLEFGFLQTRARRRDGLPQIIRRVERARVHSGHFQFEHRIGAEEADQFVRAGDFEERVFVGFDRGGLRRFGKQLTDQLFITGEKDSADPDSHEQQRHNCRNVRNSLQNTTLPITSC